MIILITCNVYTFFILRGNTLLWSLSSFIVINHCVSLVDICLVPKSGKNPGGYFCPFPPVG